MSELKTPVSPWQRLVARLPEYHQRFLARMLEFTQEKGIWEEENLRPGEVIKHGDKSWPVKAVLGAGGEGCVYLVETKHGPRAIKKFFRAPGMRANLKAFKEMAKSGAPLPKHESIKADTRTILMEYIPSVSVAYLFHSKDIRADEYQALRRRMRRLCDSYPEADIHFRNCVVEVPSGTVRPVETDDRR